MNGDGEWYEAGLGRKLGALVFLKSKEDDLIDVGVRTIGTFYIPMRPI